MKFEQLETAEGVVLRSSPTPAEWHRTRRRLIAYAIGSLLIGVAVTALEIQAGLQLIIFELLPLLVGLLWASRFLRVYQRARPTALVATDHSLRLERLDGSQSEDVDLTGVSAIRIGPDGFAIPWRWTKGPKSGLVVLRLRASNQGFVIPGQLASHPVLKRLLGRMLAASRTRGPVQIAGPQATVVEIESYARSSVSLLHSTDVPPITVPGGWYPDPAGSKRLRWWDGREWTEHLADPTLSP